LFGFPCLGNPGDQPGWDTGAVEYVPEVKGSSGGRDGRGRISPFDVKISCSGWFVCNLGSWKPAVVVEKSRL